MKKSSFLKNSWPIFVILFVVSGVITTNYTPGSWLTGWDNLHPEFNFKLNIYRSLFAVWQEYQGLGLLGGMAHASDLPRQIFLWGVSLALPLELLRYFFHFLMLPVGMLGVYFLLDQVFLSSYSGSTRKTSSLLGALFYLFNLGTIQYFYVPFEPYSTFWGMLPWELLTLFLFAQKPTKRRFLYFALANVLAVPQAYVQTIFLVYLICVSVILSVMSLTQKSKRFFRTAGMIIGTIFVINAFWLLPNIYFFITNLSTTQNAFQNVMATEKFFQMNKSRGTIIDLPLLREFYYDFFDFNDKTSKFDYMMQIWRQHYNSPLVMLQGYLLFGMAALGIAINKKYRAVILGLSLLCLIIFLSDTPGISSVNSIFRSLPLINQVFRNPFTKFIVPLVILFSLGLGMGSAYLIHKKIPRFKSQLLIPCITVLLILGCTFPVFKGYFFSPNMRVNIPKEYFNLFSYLSTQDPSGRIMNLPQGSFWGWYYYRWGARGSGFLWYGIEQPVLDRAFDVWSRENEDYYWQLSYALQKRDQKLFNQILEKYQISYVLFDKNLLFADNINSVRYAFDQEDLINKNSKLSQIAEFGKLRLYKVALKYPPKNNILGTSKLPTAYQPQSNLPIDEAFLQTGIYQNYNQSSSDLIMPFTGLFTNRTAKEKTFSVKNSDGKNTFSTTIPRGNYSLSLPSYLETTLLLPAEISAKLNGSVLSIDLVLSQPQIKLGSKILSNKVLHTETNFTVPDRSNDFYLNINNKDFFRMKNLKNTYTKIGSAYVLNTDRLNYIRIYDSNPKTESVLGVNSFFPSKNCGSNSQTASVASLVKQEGITLYAKNTANCTVYSTSLSDVTNSLVHVSFDYQSSKDEFPQFCYYSQEQGKCLNKKDIIRTGFSNTMARFNEYFESSYIPSDKGFIHLINEAQSDEDKDQKKEITYKGITVSYHPYLGGKSISLSGLEDKPQTQEINLAEDTQLEAIIQAPESYMAYSNPIAKNIYKKSPLNYDLLTGNYSLKEINKETKMLQASAQHASSYILLRASNLTAGSGYLMRLSTQHEKGLPFTVNAFTNQEYRSYMYTYTSPLTGIQTDYFILPPLYSFDKGISILLGSNSYSSTPSINNLIDVSIVPMPFDYMRQIKLIKNKKTAQAYTLPVNVINNNIISYKIIAAPNTTSIILSQGFNPGWHAYSISNPSSILQKYMPFFFSRELPHGKVNSWENGWELIYKGDTKQIAIIYIPQLLEWAGAGLFGIGVLIFIAVLAFRKQQI